MPYVIFSSFSFISSLELAAAGRLDDWFLERVTAFRTGAEIFEKISNTGSSAQRLWFGNVAGSSAPSHLDKAKIESLITQSSMEDLFKLRHPEPRLTANLTVQHDDLQLRGSWQKIRISKTNSIPPRMGFASFVWDGGQTNVWCSDGLRLTEYSVGHLYVAGGQRSGEFEFYRDLWRIKLDEPVIWEQLPSYPVSFNSVPLLCGMSMAVHADKAYLFTGRLEVDYYDLVENRWGQIKTTVIMDGGRAGNGHWFYPNGTLGDYTMQIVDGQLYIFGGSHRDAGLGCNLFTVLDLEAMQWTRLSGTALPVPDYTCPGPRKWNASWVAGDHMYVMYGVADRHAPNSRNTPYAASEAFCFSDLWAWNFTLKKWRRENINGNSPCPRSEMACTYVCHRHSLLQKKLMEDQEPQIEPTCIIRRLFS